MSYRRIVVVTAAVFAAAVLLALFLPGEKREDAPPEPETRTIRVSLWDYDVVDYDRKIVEAFEAAHPDIHVDVVSFPSLYYNSSLDSFLDSGEQIDVVYVNQISQMHQLLSRDLVLPLDKFLEKEELDLGSFPSLDVFRTEEGSLLALPYRKDKFLLYYNQDLFEKAGLAPPSGLTWEGFLETAKKLRDTLEPDERAVYLQMAALHMNYILGGEAADQRTREAAAFPNQIRYLLELEDEEVILPYKTCRNIQASQLIFETGRYSMYVQGTWYLNILKTDLENGNYSFDWGVEAKPVWYEGAEEENALWMTPLCITKRSKDPEAAWEFIRFVCGGEGAGLLADELIIPAYQDAGVRERLEENLKEYQVDPSLVLDGYGEAAPILTEEKRKYRQIFNPYYEKALTGLLSPEEALQGLEKETGQPAFPGDYI